MVKNNEIALQLVNSQSTNINVAIFPFSGVNNFDFNQTEAYQYNLSTVPFYGFEEGIYLFYRLKNTNSTFSRIRIPYTVADNGGELSVVLELFCPFLQNWFPSSNLGICVANDPDVTIWSANYEIGNIDFITDVIP